MSGVKGIPAWNKGIRMPHSAEWEAKRLAAVRESAKNRVYPKGFHRTKESIRPMLDALERERRADPEKYRKMSIANLPKNCSGEKNGNWKGGKVAKNYSYPIRYTSGYLKWRESVLQRDGHKCRICGSTDCLQVHHIIPISECSLLATLRMNGVTLCKKCHYKNDMVTRSNRNKNRISIGKPVILSFTIPHLFQEYDTCGNWKLLDGIIVIFVSETGNKKHNMLIALHELAEAAMCEAAGISEQSITDFDMEFEANRKPGDVSEPGFDKKAPYNRQHTIATGIEFIVAPELQVDINEYSRNVESL